MAGCLASAFEILLPACKSSATWVRLFLRLLFSNSLESREKTFRAETCASKRVAICRESMTTSLCETPEQNEILDNHDSFSAVSILEIVSPRLCREPTAT